MGLIAVLLSLGCVPKGGAPGTAAEQVPNAEQTATARVGILTSGNPAPARPPLPTLPPVSRSLCPSAVWWHEAWRYVAQRITAEGPVVQTRHAMGTEAQVLLEVGHRYGDPDRLTIRLGANFSSPGVYSQRTLCATGVVQRFEGIPLIEVADPSGIVVPEHAAETDGRQ
jgi:hypothetical protein